MDVITAITLTVVFLFEPSNSEKLDPIGTGFVVRIPVPESEGMFVPVIVTAKHVLGEREKIWVRFNTIEGKTTAHYEYDIKQLKSVNDYWEHSDAGVDIAVFRSPHFENTKYEAVPLDLIVTKKILLSEDIKQSDLVVFPGLLVNFYGSKNNYPVLKDGSIALISKENIPMQYNVGTRIVKTSQELILINAISVPGLSGSPVFLQPGPRLKKNSFTIGGGKPYLLGVMHGFYGAMPREVTKVETTETKFFYSDNSGVAIVFPAWKIREILEMESFKKRMDIIFSDIEKPNG